MGLRLSPCRIHFPTDAADPGRDSGGVHGGGEGQDRRRECRPDIPFTVGARGPGQCPATDRSGCSCMGVPTAVEGPCRPSANIRAKFQIKTWKVQEPGNALRLLPLDFCTDCSAEFQWFARLLSASKWWGNTCTFCPAPQPGARSDVLLLYLLYAPLRFS